MPLYVATANTLSPLVAENYARRFGTTLDEARLDFDYANRNAQEKQAKVDLRGQGLGLYLSADRLFCGYLYGYAVESACESEEAARNERDYE